MSDAPSDESPESPRATDGSAPKPQETSRRALTLAICAGTCAIAAASAIPAAAFVAAPLGAGAGSGRWVRTVKLGELTPGQAKRVAIVSDRRDAWTVERGVELGSVWLLRNGDDVTAFSAVCPHLGCSVNAAPEAGGFACPCHTSAFGSDGKRKSGPSPRDLDTLATRIEDGFVAVEFRRFRIGVPEKVET
ncbi:MAG: Rieske (2Fe-2S) protein [Labilithrix sp.]|nr:Rieske (2Fe-2S) protein [Labilithrix sp.]